MNDKEIITQLTAVNKLLNLLPVAPREHCRWKTNCMDSIDTIVNELNQREANLPQNAAGGGGSSVPAPIPKEKEEPTCN